MPLSLIDYQQKAAETDIRTSGPGALEIALLGLVGEAGTLMTEYKKKLRDGAAHHGFESHVAVELGDILWYVANIATKCGLSLDEIAGANLTKTRSRFLPPGQVLLLDASLPEAEQLPRTFEVTFRYQEIAGKRKVVMVDEAGRTIGDPLTDNAYEDDGYRFHDVLHLANAAVLGWSPVLRSLMNPKRKRKSNEQTDEVEDGGRAQIIEEAVSAVIYDYAAGNGFKLAERVDWDALRVIKRITAHLEVRVRTEAEWEQAILSALRAWLLLRENDGGVVRGNLYERSLTFVGSASGSRI